MGLPELTLHTSHASLKMKSENSSKTPGTYRVFDLGRWKEAKLCLVCQKDSPGGRNGLGLGPRSRRVVRGVKWSARKTGINSRNNHLSSEQLYRHNWNYI